MSALKKQPKKHFIEFSTKEYAPRLSGTYVTLGTEIIRNENAKLAIDLVDHPLYPQLHKYCLNNPPRKG